MGRVDMSDDWWSDREKECPGIRRSIWKEEFNMDMFEEEFGAVVVTGAEGWSVQHGEASLNSGVGVDGGDEVDSQPMLDRWILEDGDGDYDDELGLFDVPIAERLSHRTDRGAGWRHVQQLMYESDQQCYDIFRMNQKTFEALCKMLAERYGLKETHHVYIEESVAMFLETVGQDKTKMDIAARYQRSVDTVQRKLDEVLSALLKFAEDTLRPQKGEFGRVIPVLRNDDRYWPHFRDCVGALDGTHVPVRPPSQNAEAYKGRKQDPTMNVLAICSFDMKFIYAYLGVPGRAHDTKVLTHCARNEASFPHPPPGKYYLVDSGYPTRTGYLGPHRSMRYHLGQFARGGLPVSARDLFN
ncbi:uncharacterized protein LOC125587205 [Brassica napus]|uniref:uncharacterized protein LOC125587205 n=1 Tax=Brassica napus TaxID=3708 RepID=UPI00207ADBDA|nr:uncharacterized protein LOC125587205 [Brassica napus]